MASHNAGKPVRQAFTNLLRITTLPGTSFVDVSPVTATGAVFFGSQALNEANLYQEFRLVECDITVMPTVVVNSGIANDSTAWAIGYTPAVSASAPATIADVLALSDSVLQVSGSSVPIRFRLRRKQLMAGAQVKWFHVDSTPAPDTGQQGQFHYVAVGTHSTTWVLNLLVRSVFEFRAPVAFGQFLQRARDLIAHEDEKQYATPSPALKGWVDDTADDDPADGLTPSEPVVVKKIIAVGSRTLKGTSDTGKPGSAHPAKPT